MGWPEDIPHQNSDNMPQDALWILNARYSEQDEIIISMQSYLNALFVLSVWNIHLDILFGWEECELFTEWEDNWKD